MSDFEPAPAPTQTSGSAMPPQAWADPAVEPWPRLLVAAQKAAAMAYARYSQYRVGAAALAEDGRLVTGCNVENASYGLTLCAECGLVSALALGGGGRLVAFTCVNGEGNVITPCGRCRQLLAEHGGPGLAVLTPEGVVPLSALLPQSWGAGDLAATQPSSDEAPDKRRRQ